ncbi:hypothetical protein AVEN_230047-1 [Araneus ventricosus]|uniref:Uncharacterized protein n=1 Tax=Araneus ventricosus TaxID=182803 RepID=A0A4Y2CUS3_ARAVE|nr:hypothetical protein AVEN_230047-1 [Araneus ventricosus]
METEGGVLMTITCLGPAPQWSGCKSTLHLYYTGWRSKTSLILRFLIHVLVVSLGGRNVRITTTETPPWIGIREVHSVSGKVVNTITRPFINPQQNREPAFFSEDFSSTGSWCSRSWRNVNAIANGLSPTAEASGKAD